MKRSIWTIYFNGTNGRIEKGLKVLPALEMHGRLTDVGVKGKVAGTGSYRQLAALTIFLFYKREMGVGG